MQLIKAIQIEINMQDKVKNNKKGVRRYEWIFNTGQFKEVNVDIWTF